jgi:hypothetical protein
MPLALLVLGVVLSGCYYGPPGPSPRWCYYHPYRC